MATVEQVVVNTESVGEEGVRRRDFIHIAAISFAGVGGAAFVLPLLGQMSASADVLAQASIEVDRSEEHTSELQSPC